MFLEDIVLNTNSSASWQLAAVANDASPDRQLSRFRLVHTSKF